MDIETNLLKIAEEITKLSKTLDELTLEDSHSDATPEQFAREKEQVKEYFADLLADMNKSAQGLVSSWNLEAQKAVTVVLSSVQQNLAAGDLAGMAKDLQDMDSKLESFTSMLEKFNGVRDTLAKELKQSRGWLNI